ncbi:cupin domain-containing protein [Lacibacter luteus]|uniref:Cupin domain-containing protein n=1 Tax=Lacibacter luteus TaxID=2508719 RepID=A0A4Q1CM75_9BACT|nr:cupin domain-containing protein [Lacibacter luteus]RXK62123.1 cupin domain-containing protein [Lacibacter luteus]
MHSRVQQYVQQLQLHPHPEGGFYKQTYASSEQVAANALPERFAASRRFSTAIYFLLSGTDFSAFHRIKSDELWHFYEGEGLEIYVIHPNGEGELLKLGNKLNEGFSFQQLVKAGCWFASKTVDENSYALVGCTVSPGFDFDDFEMAKREELLNEYPQHKEWIERLCR